ncbi:MAG: hypothetical protein HFJ46_00305 [Clostridia bacterium]|nr:hypothetical protein [Clostridia bacterium]
MTKKKKIIIVLICLWIIFFSVDLYLTQNGKYPIFCIKYNGYNDGGTTEHLGFGYKVICFNKLGSCGRIQGISNGEMYDTELYTASYNYMCPWFTSYEKAWKRVENKAIKNGFDRIIEKHNLQNVVIY